ncbi:GerMN domain-containing protein [Bacillus sp. 7884-1]|uniref:GerMN domain-containing protein n=1 Tax=Bacillus sp. 7884-1 TaxID=2021693 RepID=UPI000BA6A7D0|nr:GerMN domain-containing protein [Bacillus sp. 7884-1]PAE43811.1 hypothetical protein CHI06_04595 [Bacillus sp. 7884-1]
MKKSEWSDKQLEELLRQMPKIEDHRNPRDIYQNLSIKKRKKSAWLIPGFAAIAALLLFFILIPRFIDGTQSFDSAKQEESSSQEKISIADDKSSILNKEEDGLSGSEAKMMMTEMNKTAIYDDEVENGKVITYWIPDSQAQILVPVSIVVPPDDNKNWLTIFTESMGLLKEEEWGLTDFYPLNATFELDEINNTVIVDVPSDHKYGDGSTGEMTFLDILQKTIASNSQINNIILRTNGQPGIEFGNYGEMDKLDVNREGKHGYFFYTPDGLETTYLVPSTNTFQDINAALEAMKTDQAEGSLASSIGPSFQIKEFSIQDNKLIINMDGSTLMENTPATVYSFEAILLTAKDFGIETIMVVNAPIKLLGPFDLSKEVKVPLAPNYRPIE